MAVRARVKANKEKMLDKEMLLELWGIIGQLPRAILGRLLKTDQRSKYKAKTIQHQWGLCDAWISALDPSWQRERLDKYDQDQVNVVDESKMDELLQEMRSVMGVEVELH